MQKNKRELEKDAQGNTIMSKKNLKIICENNELYEHPDLNEKIYLNHKENLGGLKNLQNINISYNICQTYDDLKGLLDCLTLTNIDLSHNQIICDDKIIDDLFIKMRNLLCLYLKNNPCVREFKNYRKRLVGNMCQLKYLDDRPVFIDERRLCEAWVREGKDGEMTERRNILKERDQKNERNFQEILQMQKEIKEKRTEIILKAKEESEKEIQKIRQSIEKCYQDNKPLEYIKLLEGDIDNELAKIEDLMNNFDKINVNEHKPYVYFSTMKSQEDGEIIIFNKTEQEKEIIKNKYITNPNVQKTKTKDELDEEKRLERLKQYDDEEEEKQIKLEQKIQEEEKEDEMEKLKTQFIDYSTQWKTFSLKDKEKQEKDKENKMLFYPDDQQMDIEALKKVWISEFDELLENLLVKYMFDFDKATLKFNRIANQATVKNNFGFTFQPFSVENIRKMWTYIEVQKFRNIKKENFEIHVQNQYIARRYIIDWFLFNFNHVFTYLSTFHQFCWVWQMEFYLVFCLNSKFFGKIKNIRINCYF
ncbi:leucine rich repeat protein [Ichthyophthirius multifiliis]|uniref:Leucine rich repeat protein n=1 Tax=Ichthyophthirius multifiliis TaxID=5932 RepID=G0QWU6_ICHMU|nr:leucine rich repeat protein [Ichthyophthirius multifiliis]EGR30307.1 leucine rich repeat protein [Ichthyophthirius multifiliis]|eukprot:XP_004031894.1 leucine rich repeat protein [Ichthyophthirius multifiliis]